MRNVCSILFITLFLLVACNSSVHRPDNAYIILQPLGNYPKEHVDFLARDLSRFFGKRIKILPAKNLPDSFINSSKGKRYHAGKILEWLSELDNDSIASVVALTNEDIYTTKRNKVGSVKTPASTYEVWGIFGLGYCPGPVCVASQYRLTTTNQAKFRHRLRTVVIHEIGHNLGLPHCPAKGCIMSDANEKMATVDESGPDFCASCRKKLS